MRKICLSFVLAIVSVFSISAQTNVTSAEDSGSTESVITSSDGAKIEIDSVKTIVETSDADFPVTQEPQLRNSAIMPGLAVLPLAKTLGSLSSGNLLVDSYISEFSALFNVDPLLIYAQMSQESSFKAKATSPKGAGGFMQLMPATAKRFGATNIYNPKQNIKAGIKYMSWLLDKFGGDKRLALAAYNAGEGAVIKYGNKIPPYRETQNYVVKIMTHYEQISNQNPALTVATGDKTNETVALAF